MIFISSYLMGSSPLLMPFILLVIAFTPSGPCHSFSLISSPDPLSMAVTSSSSKGADFCLITLTAAWHVTSAKRRMGQYVQVEQDFCSIFKLVLIVNSHWRLHYLLWLLRFPYFIEMCLSFPFVLPIVCPTCMVKLRIPPGGLTNLSHLL